jgi:hypothetical protein
MIRGTHGIALSGFDAALDFVFRRHHLKDA